MWLTLVTYHSPSAHGAMPVIRTRDLARILTLPTAVPRPCRPTCLVGSGFTFAAAACGSPAWPVSRPSGGLALAAAAADSSARASTADFCEELRLRSVSGAGSGGGGWLGGAGCETVSPVAESVLLVASAGIAPELIRS